MALKKISRLVIAHPQNALLRQPRFIDGLLYATHSDAQGEREVCIQLEGASPVLRETGGETFAFERGGPERCEGPSSHLLNACDGAGRAQVRFDDAEVRVVFQSDVVEERLVFSGRGTAAAVAVQAYLDGHLVAFHHNIREDDGRADLTRWIALRWVSRDGVVHRAPPMRGLDRDAAGEEQGFEFPALAHKPDGTVVVLGRGSHRFYAQVLGQHGWSERVALDEGGWGCRGHRIALHWSEPDVLRVVRREREGLVLEELLVHDCGTPGWQPQTSVASPTAKRVSRLVSGIDGNQVVFGDIHQHSAHSDGTNAPFEIFRRARYELGHDFCALSDHESFLGKRVFAGEWRHLQDVADEASAEPEFSTLYAYEWTGKMYPGPGHKVVYPFARDVEVVSRDDVPDGSGLRARLAGRAIAVPHHVGWTGADVDSHDADFQPVFEVCSCHGCYLHDQHLLGQRGALQDQMIESALSRGLRFGFIACSDGHGLLWHHGAARKRNPYETGLTAVFAAANTREGILAALQQRRCYATSGTRIVLCLRDATGELAFGRGYATGALIQASGRALVHDAWGGVRSRVSRVVVVDASGEQALTCNEHDGTWRASFVVQQAWTYLRVETDDGEMAWSSPVFVD